METSAEPERQQSKARIVILNIAVFLALCLVCFVASIIDTPSLPTLRPTASPLPPTNTPLPLNTFSPQELIENAIYQVLPTSNRNLERIIETNFTCTEMHCSTVVEWTINDNLTENMRNVGAMRDTTELLEAITTSGTAIINVRLKGTFSMVDQQGNVSEVTVVNVFFYPETVYEIDWGNFLFENIYDIADDAEIHPEFLPNP